MDAATNPRTRRAHRLLTTALALAVTAQLGVGILLMDSRADLERNQRDDDRFETCIAAWQQAFATSYEARSAAAQEVSVSVDRVVRAIDRNDPAQFGQAIDEYLQVRADQDRDRAENPLPPLPEDLCGLEP